MANISKIQLPGSQNIYDLKDNSRGIISVSENMPTDERVDIWIDPNEIYEIDIADIQDDITSFESTWSSEKIKQEIESGGGGTPADLKDYVKGIIPQEKEYSPYHSVLYENQNYSILETDTKTILGAINELASKIVVCTQSEYDAIAIKDPKIFYFIMED